MEPILQGLSIAWEHYRKRRFHEAEVITRRVLTEVPASAEAWRLLGLIALEAKQSAAAVEMIGKAVELAPDSSATHYSLGLAHEARGDVPRAIECFRQAVRLEPGQVDACHRLGGCLRAAGRPEEALGCFRKVLEVHPDLIAARRELGRTLHRLGRLEEAGASYREVLQAQPDDEAGVHLAQALRELNRPDEQIAVLHEAVRCRPTDSDAHHNLGLAQAGAGRYEEAAASFQEAARLRPGHASAINNLGAALKLLGRFDAAELALLRAIRCEPTDPLSHLNLGLLYEDQGQLPDALVSYQVAGRVAPDRAEVHRALGRLLGKMGRQGEAAAAYRRCLELNPQDAGAANELGNLLQELDRHEEAKAAYRQALASDPTLAAAHANLAYVLADEGKMDEAAGHYAAARRSQPSHRLRIVADTMLPPLYDSVEQMRAIRARLIDNLRRLEADGVRVDPTREVMPTLFYLAYQGQNDRDIHATLGRLTRGPRAVEVRPAARTGGARLHVGFLSRNLKNHTIGRLNAGLIAGLRRDRFLVTVFSLSWADDEQSRRIRDSAERYLVVPANPAEALRLVAAQGLDILFYPDVGMDPFTYTLTFSRLAPVQCVTWGHPVTTGAPEMDCFISSVDLDTAQAREHYTERLVRLRTLSVSYDPVTPPRALKGRGFFDLPETAHIYTCPQTLFKFHPEFDPLLADILRRDPAGLLLLVEGKYPFWREILWERFGQAFPDVRDRVRFVPRQSRDNYLNLLAVSDVMLDPLHFGGGNTSYEGFGLGIPIITLPSAFLRGRITYAQYRKMGLLDGVVASPEEYVRLAVSLGMNRDHREEFRARLREASGVLFEDQQAIRDLEEFFESIVADHRVAGDY